MDAEREREIRELAEALSRSNRHRRIARVLHELLYEIDLLREDTHSGLSMGEAMDVINAYAASAIADGRYINSGVSEWREAALAKQYLYPNTPISSQESSNT